MQDTLTDLGAFAGGNDHAGIRHRHPDAGHDLLENFIRNAVVELTGVDVISGAQTGHRNGVRAHAEGGFQMLSMHQQACKLIAVQLQTEEDAQTHVIDAAFHGPVVGLGVVGVVALGAGGVQLFVRFLVVGLLEEDVGADAGFLQLAVVLHGGGSDVDIDTADGAVLMLDGVDGLDGLQNVLQRIIPGILAAFQRQTLVAHILQGDDLGPDFLLGQLLAGDVLVLTVVGAVGAAVDAVIAQVQGRKHDDTVAVEILLDLLGQRIDLLIPVFQLTGQQHGCFPVAQALAQLRLLDDGIDEDSIGLMGVGIGQGIQHLLMVNEFLCLHGFGIVHNIRSFLMGQ